MPVVREVTAGWAGQIADPPEAAAWADDRRPPLLAQMALPQSGACIGSFAFFCVSAVFAGALVYAAIRLIHQLTGYDLSEIIKGDKPLVSFRWLALLALGIAAGALATLLAAWACLILT
ncbi:MAG: hypothetical protein Tsb0032_33350 [Kiloniellaceae bacterium]